MPMVPPGLAAAIKTEVEAEFGTPADPVLAQKYHDAIARAVVNYIKANATVIIASVTGVTPGGGVSGPGTGTVT